MAMSALNRRQYAEFKRLLEKALLEIRLPAGIVDTDQIIPGCIRPENCDLDATWNFRGSVSLGSNMPKSISQEDEEENVQGSLATGGYSGSTSNSGSTSASVNVGDNQSQELVVFLDAVRGDIIHTLPSAMKNNRLKAHIKRIDLNDRNICRIETFQDDKIDNEERIIMSVHEAVILIADSGKWHILSRYTPPEFVQSLEGSHVSNVNSKVMLLTTD